MVIRSIPGIDTRESIQKLEVDVVPSIHTAIASAMNKNSSMKGIGEETKQRERIQK